MKKISLIFMGIAVLFFTQKGTAETHTVLVGQSAGLTFSPSSITTVAVGDIIRFTWVSGSHTTTSVNIPGGAATWNSDMTASTTQFEYTVTVEGTYEYQCNPHSGAGMTGSFVASTTTSAQVGSTIYTSMLLSPNPASDKIELNFKAEQSFDATVLIFDSKGIEKMKKQAIVQIGENSLPIDISGLRKGIYIVNILDGRKALVAKKFVKE